MNNQTLLQSMLPGAVWPKCPTMMRHAAGAGSGSSGLPPRDAGPKSDVVSPLAVIRAVAVILVLFVLCDAMAAVFAIPFPGAALGMLLLLTAFKLNGGPDASSERIFDAIAPHIPVFFVPAATGIIANLDSFGQAWTAIVIAIVVGTALALVATGCLMQSLLTSVTREVEQ